MNELRELLLARLAELGEPGQPLSLRRAAEQSQGLVSYETLRQLLRGEHSGDISDRTAQGVARALRIPVREIYRAARVARPIGHWQWPERFDRLTLPQRRIVESIAAALLDAYGEGLRDAGSVEGN